MRIGTSELVVIFTIICCLGSLLVGGVTAIVVLVTRKPKQ